MSRYVIFGGFLGAGKTTTMMALTDVMRRRGIPSGIVVNDLGSRDLVDAEFTRAMGYAAEMINGGCICWLHDELMDDIRRLRDEEHAELILSDIPGCGIGALEHVYHFLAKEYPGEVTLAPFAAVADPVRLQRLLPDPVDIHLPEEMDYIFDAQLNEAEMIILNKIDTLTEQKTEELAAWLREQYPHAPVFPMSARTGAGVEEVLDWIMTHESALPKPDLGDDTPAFAAAEEWLSWYDCQFIVRSEEPFRGNEFSAGMMDNIRSALAAAGRNVPHLKMMAEADTGELCKISLIGIDQPLSPDLLLTQDCRSLSVIINARAACEKEKLTALCDLAVAETARAFGMIPEITHTEAINMMDD